jgi:hypothetical protein
MTGNACPFRLTSGRGGELSDVAERELAESLRALVDVSN